MASTPLQRRERPSERRLLDLEVRAAATARTASRIHPPHTTPEGTDMISTQIQIDGMSCSHCEQAVTDELMKLDGVTSVEVSAEDGSARIASEAPLDRNDLAEAIEEAGYELLDD